jgi:CRP-like cAMP-binding protein
MSSPSLLHVPLFASLPPEALLELENILEKVKLKEGQILFREGDLGDSLYIILDGSLEI